MTRRRPGDVEVAASGGDGKEGHGRVGDGPVCGLGDGAVGANCAGGGIGFPREVAAALGALHEGGEGRHTGVGVALVGDPEAGLGSAARVGAGKLNGLADGSEIGYGRWGVDDRRVVLGGFFGVGARQGQGVGAGPGTRRAGCRGPR